MGQLKACWLPLVMAVFFRLSAEWLHREDAGAAAAPPFENPACSQANVTVVCLSILARIQEHTLHALLRGYSHQRPGTLFALAKNTCSLWVPLHAEPHVPSLMSHKGWDAMLLPPVLTCLGVSQNQGGTADSIYGSWAAGLFWIAGRFVANTRSTWSVAQWVWHHSVFANLRVWKDKKMQYPQGSSDDFSYY